jgi:hypothetical protein
LCPAKPFPPEHPDKTEDSTATKAIK